MLHLKCTVLRVHLVEQGDAPLLHHLRSPYAHLLVTVTDVVGARRSQHTVAVAPLPAGLPLFLLCFCLLIALARSRAGFLLAGEEHGVGQEQLVWPPGAGKRGGRGEKLYLYWPPTQTSPAGAVFTPQEPQLLHFRLQLLLPGPGAPQQGETLLQAPLLLRCQLTLLLCRLPAVTLRRDLALEGLDGAQESSVLLLRILLSVSVGERAQRRPRPTRLSVMRGRVHQKGKYRQTHEEGCPHGAAFHYYRAYYRGRTVEMNQGRHI